MSHPRQDEVMQLKAEGRSNREDRYGSEGNAPRLP
jgi:hypothetical protein